jgi:hypothetical protein
VFDYINVVDRKTDRYRLCPPLFLFMTDLKSAWDGFFEFVPAITEKEHVRL